MELLQVENLNFTYPGSREKALNGVSFSLEPGSFTLLMGASGSGKTTLLQILKKEIAPFGEKSGSLRLGNRPLEEAATDRIGYVAQSPESQIVTDRVWHELAFGAENMGLESEEIRLRVGETASYFGIGEWYHRHPDTLSGGQKQLLNLASVMVMRPEMILLDEPTAQLDPIAAANFIATLKKINRELGVTVLISEHRLEECFPAADRVLVLEKGRLIAGGTPKEVCFALREHPLFAALPSAARIWRLLGSKGECPLTVKEGREFLHRFFPTVQGKTETKPFTESAAAVELQSVSFRYDRTAPDVVREMSLRVNSGEIFAVLGENGSGKSTTLRLIAGLSKPYTGSCRVFGKTISQYKGNSLYRELLVFLPQDPTALFLENTVEDDLRESFCLMGKPREEYPECAAKWIDLFEIAPLLNRHPYDLSGGEQQKCALVKLLMRAPKILLLDEPTKGLDAAFKQKLVQALHVLRQEGMTVIMVTHDVEFAADTADRCGLLFDGKVLAVEQPNRFFAGNMFYTTAAARMARGKFENTVRCAEITALCKGQAEI